MVDMDEAVTEAAAFLGARTPVRPKIAVVLGTGLGAIADEITRPVTIPYTDIPHFPRATALSHSGHMVLGHLHGNAVVAMQGRFHLYEGYDADQVALPVRVLRALGASSLIVTNASGGLNPQFQSGDLLVMESHIDLMFCHRRSRPDAPVIRTSPSYPYDPEFMANALHIARRENFAAHRGVYAALVGPNYETRAEYRFLRKFADAVGMSTVPEVCVAAELGMRVLGLSVITNVARPDAPAAVTAEAVVDFAVQARPRLRAIISGVVREA